MIYLVCILTYLLLLVGIGIAKARQVKSHDDFAVAGRSLSPWVMVCTMLAVWIGTGSILGNAEQTYEAGMAGLLLPCGTVIGMILLAMVATRARNIEASSVPEIIGGRFGQTARMLSVVSLVIAYMVIVSYQYNAGGAVLEVIAGDHPPETLAVGDEVSARQLSRGQVIYTAEQNWTGRTTLKLRPAADEADAAGEVDVVIAVATAEELLQTRESLSDAAHAVAVKVGNFRRLRLDRSQLPSVRYVIAQLPESGALELHEPILTAMTATMIAAAFIIVYTSLAGLLSLAYADIVTGTVITVTLLITFPVYWLKAGGWEGMQAAYAAMGDRPDHMKLWGVYSTTELINYCLPPMLLVMGDANQYQRIFASRDARGARAAVTTMIFVAFAIELLIIASAWVAGSMTPDPENGKYILIYAARHYLALPLSCLFMITVVGIIVSTANSFLLVPSTTVIQDVYLNYINPRASEKRILLLSRLLVVSFGVIAFLVSLAFAESTGFFRKALYAFTIYGASITPSLVAAIVWKRATPAGAIASILSGTVVSIVWSEMETIFQWFPGLAERAPATVTELDAVLPAIVVSVVCLVVVSLFTPQRNGNPTRKRGELA